MVSHLDKEKQVLKLKSNSLALLSFAISISLAIITLKFYLFPDPIESKEISLKDLLYIDMLAGTLIVISGIFAVKQQIVKAYILFFFGIFIGCCCAIYSGGTELQIQNSLHILSVAILVATFMLETKKLIMINMITIISINFAYYMLDINPLGLFVGYIFFHLTCLSTIWISILRFKVQKIEIEDAKRNAKLKEVGYLAGSIAHEINNPLTIIRFATEQAQKILEDSDDLNLKREDLSKVIGLSFNHGQRIGNIIQSVFSLIKSKDESPLPIITTKLMIQQLAEICENIKIEYEVSITLPDLEESNRYLEAQSSEVIQILTNLIRNAASSVSKQKDKRVWIEIEEFEERICILVKDSGPGLSDKVREQLGNVFNSGNSEGLGFGLSISMALAAKNNSQLTYNYTAGVPTFTLNFPLLKIPREISPNKYPEISSDPKAHLIKLSNDTVFIYMRDGKYIVQLDQFKNLLSNEKKLLGVSKFHYIVYANNSDLSKEAKMYFNSPDQKEIYLSGAIIGSSSAVANTVNIFTKVFTLPYPVRVFTSFVEAREWTKHQNSKN